MSEIKKSPKPFLLSFLLLILTFFAIPKTVKAVALTRSVYVQNVTTNSAEFMWKTDTGAAGINVKYGTSTSYGSQVTADSALHAKATGLSANTKYYYQLVSGTTALTPAGDANYYFRTAPPTGSTTPFTWVIWGDGGTGSSNQTAVANQVAAKKPDLVLVAGDVAYPYDLSHSDSLYFGPYKNIMKFSPFYPTCGNHDNCSNLVNEHSLPGGGSVGGTTSTFSWDYGNVHFAALNSNTNVLYDAVNPQNSAPQIKWAYNDLKASSQPWKVVYWHHNGWSSGSHSTNTNIVDNVIRMASDAGADLVIWGHSHVYERWNRKTGFYPDLQAYTIGNGGKSGSSGCTSTSPGPGCAAKSTASGESGFLFFEMNGNSATVRYIKMDGSNPDTITLTSSGGGGSPPPTQTLTPSPTPSACQPGTKPGDANGDCKVDGFDYVIWWQNFSKNVSGGPSQGDFNSSGFVDGFDYVIWWQNFNK